MTTVYDVPAPKLIDEAAKRLHEVKEIVAPEWAEFAKTGVHTEKPPVQEDWWHTRVAAVLRKVYTDGPVGTETLRAHFGGFRDRGNRPNKAAKGSGSIAREALQQLESAGLVQTVQAQGRVVTAKGRGLMDNAAHAVRATVQKDLPALAKY
jgi:small subunit ribosomal protein S19e